MRLSTIEVENLDLANFSLDAKFRREYLRLSRIEVEDLFSKSIGSKELIVEDTEKLVDVMKIVVVEDLVSPILKISELDSIFGKGRNSIDSFIHWEDYKINGMNVDFFTSLDDKSKNSDFIFGDLNIEVRDFVGVEKFLETKHNGGDPDLEWGRMKYCFDRQEQLKKLFAEYGEYPPTHVKMKDWFDYRNMVMHEVVTATTIGLKLLAVDGIGSWWL